MFFKHWVRAQHLGKPVRVFSSEQVLTDFEAILLLVAGMRWDLRIWIGGQLPGGPSTSTAAGRH
jgi:hypothetical protein